MKVILKFASFDSWGHPQLATKISEILGTKDPNKSVKLTSSQSSLINEVLNGSFYVYTSMSYSIKDIYDRWKIETDPKYNQEKEEYMSYLVSLNPIIDKLSIGETLLSKIGDNIVYLQKAYNKRNQLIVYYGIRKYKDDSKKLTSRGYVQSNVVNKMILDKSIKTSDVKNPVNKVVKSSMMFGSYDKINFGEVKPSYRKSPFPIPITEYDFSIKEEYKIMISRSERFKDYQITGPGSKEFDKDLSDKFLVLIKDGNKKLLLLIMKSEDIDFRSRNINYERCLSFGYKYLPKNAAQVAYYYPVSKIE